MCDTFCERTSFKHTDICCQCYFGDEPKTKKLKRFIGVRDDPAKSMMLQYVGNDQLAGHKRQQRKRNKRISGDETDQPRKKMKLEGMLQPEWPVWNNENISLNSLAMRYNGPPTMPEILKGSGVAPPPPPSNRYEYSPRRSGIFSEP